MSDPFRDAPPQLVCPRCSETLEALASGVAVCGRCDGVWLPATSVERAFGTIHWPQGPNAWWRRELQCPACALENRSTVMSAIIVDTMIVDRCDEHGEWLDAGELGRLLHAPPAIELEAFYERLAPDSELPARLLEFRKLREEERAKRLDELEKYRVQLEADQARIRAEQEAARIAERERAVKLAAEQRRDVLAKQRAQIFAERSTAKEWIESQQRELAAHRIELEKRERALTAQRETVRQREKTLGESQARMIELERQLAELDAQLG